MSTGRDVAALAYRLLAGGRAAEAMRVTGAALAASGNDHLVLDAHAAGLKADGRVSEALKFAERAVGLAPQEGRYWHNLAAVYGELSMADAAVAAAERAFALGIDAPETWLIYARAKQTAGQVEDAERAFRSVLQRRPGFVDAAADLASLIWMRTGDVAAAGAPLAAQPLTPTTALLQARLLSAAGRPAEALEAVERTTTRYPADTALCRTAGGLSLACGDLTRAERWLAAALRLSPEDLPSRQSVVALRLAQGKADQALEEARDLSYALPTNQSLLAYLATASRLAGGAEHRALYDYDSFVRTYSLPVPAGWSDQAAFLKDLKAALDALHVLRAHPVDQSVRGGTQTTQDLSTCQAAPVRAFFDALRGCVDDYLAALGDGSDPLRSRNTGRWRVQGAWSVRLDSEGFHTDHVHPSGWLSSAFYIDVPPHVVASKENQGWLRLGKPGIMTSPELEAERCIRPEPGLLVLFPSYMWHGTIPYKGPGVRMTIAFDIVPA